MKTTKLEATKQPGSNADGRKQPYKSPRLTRLGTVRELTLRFGGSVSDGSGKQKAIG